MKTGTTLFLCTLLLGGCIQKNSIEGEIKKLKNDRISLTIMPIPESISNESLVYRDTIRTKNGKFSYNLLPQQNLLLLLEPHKGYYKRTSGGEYHPESNLIMLYWQPGEKIRVKGTYTPYTLSYTAWGNEYSLQHSLNRSQTLQNLTNLTQIEIKLDSLNHSNPSDPDIDALFRKRSEERKKIKESQLSYVLDNPSSELSAFYLSQLSADTIVKYHHRLDQKVRNGMLKDILDYWIKKHQDRLLSEENKSKIRTGNTAPDFTLKSTSGELISLYSLENKIVVLDFWGSWCGWCIKGFPKMKEYYHKYKEKIVVLGIACHDSEEDWRNAVKEYNLEWINVRNDEESNISVKYGVEGYPTKIILNEEKRILAVFKGESEEFYKKLDELMQ